MSPTSYQAALPRVACELSVNHYLPPAQPQAALINSAQLTKHFQALTSHGNQEHLLQLLQR